MRLTRRAFAGLAGLAPLAAKASSLVSVPSLPQPIGPGLALVHGLGPMGGVAWTPASLPGLTAWYDAKTAASIILNGSTVSQWNDRSPNAYNAIQGTAANQLTYNATGMNSFPCLTGNGSTTLMTAAVPAGAFTAGMCCY